MLILIFRTSVSRPRCQPPISAETGVREGVSRHATTLHAFSVFYSPADADDVYHKHTSWNMYYAHHSFCPWCFVCRAVCTRAGRTEAHPCRNMRRVSDATSKSEGNLRNGNKFPNINGPPLEEFSNSMSDRAGHLGWNDTVNYLGFINLIDEWYREWIIAS